MTDETLRLAPAELLRQLPDAVIVTDLDGVITFWNEGAEGLYGWSDDEALGRRVADLLKTEFFSSDREHAIEVLTTQGKWREDVIQYDRDGRRLVVAASVASLKEDGEPVGRIAVNRDLTRMRELERDVLRMAKLESVSFVAGGIAHDVKNMLSGAMGLAELISRRLGDDPTAVLARKMKESLRDAATLTARMVDYSRNHGVSMEVIDLDERLEELSHILRGLLPEQFELRIQSTGEPLPLRLEAGQLDQIVLNLIVNARDAMPDGGTIEVTMRQESEGTPPMQYARFIVADQGVGVDDEARDRIFEPYFTTKPAGIGTGLGLATVRDIVERYHGSIEVESNPGGGARFSLRLPLAPEGQPAPGSGEA